MAEIPEGPVIENVWVVEATYAPDAAKRRIPVRQEHLTRMGELMKAGTVLLAGAYADMSGSLMVVRAPDEAAALAIAQDDVYVRAGVWTGFRVRAFGAAIRSDEPRG